MTHILGDDIYSNDHYQFPSINLDQGSKDMVRKDVSGSIYTQDEIRLLVNIRPLYSAIEPSAQVAYTPFGFNKK
jgi:hypothetical protein